MITIQTGNILDIEADALVNTVNCVGVMGRGIALQFRKAYPNNYKEYEAACKRGEIVPGKMFIHFVGTLTSPQYIINFPTKKHWKGKSRLEYIDAGLDALIHDIQALKITSIAIPPLGCGLGGLQWTDVRPRIEKAFSQLPSVRVHLLEPAGSPAAAAMPREHKVPNMTLSSAVLVRLMQQYLAGLMTPYISLLEIHKLMYFMQEAGQSLDLQYAKHTYGPYAVNLRFVLLKADGHFISGYGDGEDSPTKPIQLLAPAIEQASHLLKTHKDTEKRFEKVADLISGFESSYGLELLATLHWVITRENSSDVDDAIKRVYQWSDRKKMFKRSHIELAYDVLRNQGWMTA